MDTIKKPQRRARGKELGQAQQAGKRAKQAKRAAIRLAAGLDDKGPWTPERVRNRIRIGLIAARLENQSLGLLKKKGHNKQMTPIEFAAAKALLDKCLPNAQSALDVNMNASITVVRRDPTQRPDGYGRKNRINQPE